MKGYLIIPFRGLLVVFIIAFCSDILADDYYWIGGSGNWSDINNWSQSSGGTILHIQTPTSEDNVFFDENSFTEADQVVTVNTENAICKSLNWSGALYNPEFTGDGSNNLRVYGSVLFIDQMHQNFFGTFTFQSTEEGNTITSNGHVFNSHIFFDGIGGSWELSDDLIANGNIYLNNGSFSTKGKNINCFSFFTTPSSERTLTINNSIIELSASWNATGSGLQFSAVNSLIRVQGSLTNFYGDTLIFHNVEVINPGTIKSDNVYSVFQTTVFHSGGTIEGTIIADTVLFEEMGLSCNINEQVKIQYAELYCTNNSVSGNNEILLAYGNGRKTRILGENQIAHIEVTGNADIFEQNHINYIFISDTGSFAGENIIGEVFLGKTSYINGTNSFEICTFNCDGYINGDNYFNILTFTPGFRYFLGYESYQSIGSDLFITGNCEAPIFIKSSYNGIPATITKMTGGISGDFLSLRDIHVTGPGPFNAMNSVDLGNNEGWNIDTSPPKDLYWVGGQGNWDDMDHWSESSGGPGGSCPPTEIDNTFFDGASMSGNDTAFINVKNAVCKTIDWTGSLAGATLSGPDTNFQVIYGSLYYSPSMKNDFRGETHFEAVESGKIINSYEIEFLNAVRIQGRGGEWMLESKLRSVDTLFFEHGIFHTNHNNVHAKKLSSADTNLRSFYLYTDTIFIEGGGFDYNWEVDAKNLIMDADSSVLVFTEQAGSMINRNHEYLIFNNVHFKNDFCLMENEAYCAYNLITFDGSFGKVEMDCSIDTVIFYGYMGIVEDSDTIKTAIFHQDSSKLEGAHLVEIAYFYGTGQITGGNEVDTALFYSNGYINQANKIDTTIIFGNALIEGYNEIRTATLKNNGYFLGENIFNDLFFEYSKLYKFEKGSEQTIIDTLIANGRCTGPIFLISDEHGQQASIRKTNGNITVDYANIRDINALGPESPFLAYNSIDLGGNTNWEIYQHEPLALYWVGNSGIWSDSLHWAYESGGVPGYCIPSPIDDVYFDHNSFSEPSTVSINVEIAACHNMNWEGSLYVPELSDTLIEQPSLYIYGSLNFIPQMENKFEGTVCFATSEKDHFIEPGGQDFLKKVIFDGPEGSWHLQSRYSNLETTLHKNGDLFTEGYDFSARSFYSIDSTNRSLFLANSTVYVGDSILQDGRWQVNSFELNLDADSSTFISWGPVISEGNGSDYIQYNDVFFKIPNSLIHTEIHGRYDDVIFELGGQISGNCTIDTLLFGENGNVAGSDTINYAHFQNTGSLSGGEHIVNTAIYDGVGTISGHCKVGTALFNSSGTITGNNIIDTTIFYSHGNIQGENIFNSQVLIYGNGTIVGGNTIQKNLVIHGVASIFENNNVYNALLLDWGYLGGSNIFNILTLTPGKTYTLTASTVQTVNDTFNIRGNNCFPITLISSSSNNLQADIYMPEGQVAGDFIVMKNIAASGNALFYAGGHSDNISNNTGWIWEDAPGYIYGLGEDLQFLCEGETLELSTANFNGNPNTIYEWFDGTISPSYEVSEPGIYSLNVYYSDDCSVYGEIVVEELPAPDFELGEDEQICQGEFITLETNQEFENYLWSNGSINDSIKIDSTGTYWLHVTNSDGCSKKDSVDLEVLPAPQVDLGNDMILHNGDIVTLDAGYPGGVYDWSTGETSQTISATGIEGGLEYIVEVLYAGCKGSDSIVIDEYPYCTADVPTAFTPNRDGHNDTLFVYGSGIQTLDFKIFDRFGELVFQTDNINKGWDGTTYGQQQGNEVYVYYLKAICFDGLITEKKGNITLIR